MSSLNFNCKKCGRPSPCLCALSNRSVLHRVAQPRTRPLRATLRQHMLPRPRPFKVRLWEVIAGAIILNCFTMGSQIVDARNSYRFRRLSQETVIEEEDGLCKEGEFYDAVIQHCAMCSDVCKPNQISLTFCRNNCPGYFHRMFPDESDRSQRVVESRLRPSPGPLPHFTTLQSQTPRHEQLIEKPLFWTSVLSLGVSVISSIVIIVICVRKRKELRARGLQRVRGRHTALVRAPGLSAHDQKNGGRGDDDDFNPDYEGYPDDKNKSLLNCFSLQLSHAKRNNQHSNTNTAGDNEKIIKSDELRQNTVTNVARTYPDSSTAKINSSAMAKVLPVDKTNLPSKSDSSASTSALKSGDNFISDTLQCEAPALVILNENEVGVVVRLEANQNQDKIFRDQLSRTEPIIQQVLRNNSNEIGPDAAFQCQYQNVRMQTVREQTVQGRTVLIEQGVQTLQETVQKHTVHGQTVQESIESIPSFSSQPTDRTELKTVRGSSNYVNEDRVRSRTPPRFYHLDQDLLSKDHQFRLLGIQPRNQVSSRS